MITQKEKAEQVYEVLLMPIICDKSTQKIERRDNVIWTSQNYYSGADEDMSDIAIGYYSIIYQSILNGKDIIDKSGYFVDKEFAGDTMNSFNTIANKTPGAGKSRLQRTQEEQWPQQLIDYKNSYHCLANFWLLPMEIGRTTRGELNKAKSPISDYVDRFLNMINEQVKFAGIDRPYFHYFKDFQDFADKHFLIGAYVTENLEVIEYSQDESTFIEKANQKIKGRAKRITESKYVDELWNYFYQLNILK